MNTLKLTLFIALFSLVLSVTAQRGMIEGMVRDNTTGNSVPFAAVSVFAEDYEKLVRGITADGNGEFTIKNTGFGTFNVVISYVGYETDTFNQVLVSQETTPVDMGDIRLLPALVRLEDDVVQDMVNTYSRGIDRQTYRPADFETAMGGTAIDVLDLLPPATIQPDGTVLLRGSTEFMVYLNGKPARLHPSVLLGLISANSIESIDIITVPTARYVAQGKGGIINISTRTSGQEGLTVAANATVGGAPWGNITDEYSSYKLNDNRYNAGVNAAFRKDDFSVYAGLNHRKRNVNGSRTGEARLIQPNGSYYHMVASGERPEWNETYSANAGFDYRFSEMNSISGSWYYGNRSVGHSSFYVYNNFFADIDKQPINGIETLSNWIYNHKTDDRYGIFHTGNVDYTHQFINNSQLKVSLLFEHSELNRELLSRNHEFDNSAGEVGELQRFFRETDDAPLNGYRLSVEYDIELENGGVFGVGFQPQILEQSGPLNYDTLNAGTGEWVTNAKFSNSIDLSRNIYAGYVDYAGGWGNFDFMAGMRVEYTDRSLELSNPDYIRIFERQAQNEYKMNRLNWFPTLHAQFGINERNRFILAASRRINRPPAKNMVPFLYRRHFEVYMVGNPALKPEYLNNAELSLNHTLGEQNITLTGFMRGTNNAISPVNTVYTEENVLTSSYTNSGNVLAVGGELNTDFTTGDWAQFFLGGSLYNFKVENDAFGHLEDNESTNWSLKGNMNLLLTNELKFTLDFNYRSGTVTMQGSSDEFYMANTALNYSPEKLDKWEFGVKVLDVLSSNVAGLTTRAYDITGTQIFYREVEYERFGPIVEVSASFLLN